MCAVDFLRPKRVTERLDLDLMISDLKSLKNKYDTTVCFLSHHTLTFLALAQNIDLE